VLFKDLQIYDVPKVPIFCSRYPEDLFLKSRCFVPDLPIGVPDLPIGVPNVPKSVPDVPTKGAPTAALA
jgi:hypothetical protein